LFDPTPLETSPANERRRIQQLYKAGDLTPEVATAQLLRLDIDAIARARELNRRTDSPQAALRLPDNESTCVVQKLA
jgi:hypothetical protein